MVEPGNVSEGRFGVANRAGNTVDGRITDSKVVPACNISSAKSPTRTVPARITFALIPPPPVVEGWLDRFTYFIGWKKQPNRVVYPPLSVDDQDVVVILPHQSVLDPVEYFLPAAEHSCFSGRRPRNIRIAPFICHGPSAMLYSGLRSMPLSKCLCRPGVVMVPWRHL